MQVLALVVVTQTVDLQQQQWEVRNGGKREREEGDSVCSVWLADHTLAACSPLQQHSSTVSSLATRSHFPHYSFTVTVEERHVLRHAAADGSLACKQNCTVYWWTFDWLTAWSYTHTHIKGKKWRETGKQRGISLLRTWGLSQEWQKCREWILFAGAPPSSSKQPSLKAAIFDSFTRRMHVPHCTHTHSSAQEAFPQWKAEPH